MLDNECTICPIGCQECIENNHTDLIWLCGGEQICPDCFTRESGVACHPNQINKKENRDKIHIAVEAAREARHE